MVSTLVCEKMNSKYIQKGIIKNGNIVHNFREVTL